MLTVVLIDYQNMYRGARDAFGWASSPGQFGNFRPIAMARMLTSGERHDLDVAHVYTGVPTPERDRKGNAIMQRRTQAWETDAPDLVSVHTRPLRYPPPRGREKGVDVELAVDLVRIAVDREDVECIIVASADSDLVPALDFAVQRREALRLETVAYEPLAGYEGDTAAPIDVTGGGAERRQITKTEFERMADRRNFVTGTQTVHPGQSGRRLPPHRQR